MNKGYRIAVIPGDGIGPEVVDEAVNVLELLKNIDLTFNLEFEILSPARGDNAERWIRYIKKI